MNSELLRRDVVIVATALRPLNGVEDPTVPEHCVMPVVFVSHGSVYKNSP